MQCIAIPLDAILFKAFTSPGAVCSLGTAAVGLVLFDLAPAV
jgi:hypothetical protein